VFASPPDPCPSPARPLAKAIAAAAKRAVRKGEKLRADLSACAQAQDRRECGEILKAHLHEVRRGMESVDLPDLYRPGATRAIPLDPRLLPLENARRYFKQHRKLAKGEAHVREQLARCEAEGSALAALAARLAAWMATADPGAAPPPEMLSEARRLRAIHLLGHAGSTLAWLAGTGLLVLVLGRRPMPAAAFEQQFETLALELAQVSAEIRRRGGS